jgi:hypothetical protein
MLSDAIQDGVLWVRVCIIIHSIKEDEFLPFIAIHKLEVFEFFYLGK